MSNPGDKSNSAADDAAVLEASEAAAAAAAAAASATPPEAPEPPADGGVVPPVDGAAPPADSKTPPAENWKAQKYDKVWARLKETEAELAATKAAAADPNKPGLDESEVNRRAAALAATQEYNRRCNEVALEARKVYPKFDDAVKNLQKLVTPGDAGEIASYSRLVEAAIETGEGGRLLYELGGNLDEAARIMTLSPVKQGIELAKLAAKKGEPEPSKLPKPIEPLGGTGDSSLQIKPDDKVRSDKLSGSEWIRRRQADIDARRKNGERVW